MTLNFFSNFKFDFDCSEAIFYKIKINSHGVYVINKKIWRNVSYKSKKSVCINVNSHVNISKINNSKTSNNDDFRGN